MIDVEPRCEVGDGVEDDILFVRFSREPVKRTVMRAPDILVDLDANGNVISLEVVGVRGTTFEAVLAVMKEFGILFCPILKRR